MILNFSWFFYSWYLIFFCFFVKIKFGDERFALVTKLFFTKNIALISAQNMRWQRVINTLVIIFYMQTYFTQTWLQIPAFCWTFMEFLEEYFETTCMFLSHILFIYLLYFIHIFIYFLYILYIFLNILYIFSYILYISIYFYIFYVFINFIYYSLPASFPN